MALKNSTIEWGSAARFLHWFIVILLIVQFALAWTAETKPEDSPEQLALLSRHISFGVTILLLVVARILWRFANPTPAAPAGARGWELLTSKATFGLLYLLLLAIPITGYVMTVAHGDPVYWFGVQLPTLSVAHATHDRAHAMHEILGWVLLAFITLHVLAALKHHFIARNDVLRRMRPW